MSDNRVIDADGHVMELDEQLWEYMGPPYKHGQWHRSYAFFPSLDGFTRARTLAAARVKPSVTFR